MLALKSFKRTTKTPADRLKDSLKATLSVAIAFCSKEKGEAKEAKAYKKPNKACFQSQEKLNPAELCLFPALAYI